MIRIQKILFPTDFSKSADRAFAHAVYLARKYEAELHMLHVIVLHGDDPYNPAHHFPDVDKIETELGQIAKEQFDATREQRKTKGLTIKQVQRRETSAAPAVVEYAEEEDIDLIVMGTHGRRGVRHFFAGSVTEEVIRKAPCAVLAVRLRSEDHPLAAIQRVLAPIDFSEASRTTLPVARQVAKNYEAELQLLHVLEDTLHPAFYNMGAMSIKDLQPDIEERGEKALRDLDAAAEGPDVATSYHLKAGNAAQQIIKYAEEQASDIIVIASHGLTDAEPFLMGSVTEKVLRRAPCPVLVVRTQGKSLLR